MIFNLVVRHFRWLARIPGMPHFFDALLTAGTGAFYPQRLSAMEKLEREALSLPGVQLSIHRFGGIEFLDENGRELGHLHGHGLLDVLVGRERAKTLIANGRVRRHHVLPHSGWVSFQIESAADVSFALELLMRADHPNIQ